MLLALALADHASDDGTRVYPSIKALAEKTRRSERSVQYQLRRMQEAGWLILVNAGNGGPRRKRRRSCWCLRQSGRSMTLVESPRASAS